jgi:hypothetical protein
MLKDAAQLAGVRQLSSFFFREVVPVGLELKKTS